MARATTEPKHNVCGIIVKTHKEDQAALLAFLSTIESCKIINSTNTQLAAIIEDTVMRSASEAMALIKDLSIVQDVTLINHFYQ